VVHCWKYDKNSGTTTVKCGERRSASVCRVPYKAYGISGTIEKLDRNGTAPAGVLERVLDGPILQHCDRLELLVDQRRCEEALAL
jgi:hypothetical protein